MFIHGFRKRKKREIKERENDSRTQKNPSMSLAISRLVFIPFPLQLIFFFGILTRELKAEQIRNHEKIIKIIKTKYSYFLFFNSIWILFKYRR